MNVRRTIGPSLRALSTHSVRALLAIASVTSGVAAVLLTSAIGVGVEGGIAQQIDAVGANLLVVRPAQVKRLVTRKDVTGVVTTLRTEDLELIAASPGVAEAVPGIDAPVKVKAGAATATTKVLGTAPAFLEIRRFRMARGRFFDDDDNRAARRVAVVGARVADSLFDGNPLGQQIRIRRVPFEVIGVLQRKGVVAGGDEDNQVVVPIQTAARRLFNVTWLSTIFVTTDGSQDMTTTQQELSALLRVRHRLLPDTQPDFEVQNASSFLALQRQTAEALQQLSAGIAMVALIIGGIRILALMLLSVRERTGEIGLRVALGARPRDIFVQFLSEASLLALGGWTGGLLLAVASSAVVAVGTTWTIGVPWGALVSSLVMAMTMGLGFGAFPARRAALIPPIQALRRE
jgi:putative ABC transport system permease protein